MGLFGSSIDDLARRGDVEGLIDLLGPLDKQDVQARRVLLAMGAEAVPALLSLALHDDSAAAGTLSPRVAAALSVLVLLGKPTLDAAVRAVETSDDALVVGNAAELIHRTALELGVAVPDAVKEEVQRKTGIDWAHVSGEWLDGAP